MDTVDSVPGAAVGTQTHAGAVTAAEDPTLHELKPGVVSLLQSTIFGIATSAPGQSTAVTLAAMVAVSAYATGPAIILSTLPMLAIALAYQRLNLWEQNCGGPYVWVGRAINPYVGYMIGWAMLVGYVLGSVSDILPLGPSFLSFIGLNATGVVGNILTASFVGLGITAIGAIGIQVTARFQLSIALLEYVILLVFSGIAFYAVFVGHWAGTVHPSLAWLHIGGVGGKGSLASAMLISIYLFTGWDASIYINEETKHKEKNPGKAVLISVAILGPFFAWLFISFQGVVSGAKLTGHASSALAYVGDVLVGSAWGKFLIFAVILSVIGTTQASVVSASRISYSMGTDRLIPKFFGSVHSKFRTPFIATLIWGLLTVLVADLYVSSSTLAHAFTSIVASTSVAFTVFYIFTGIATSWYYRKLLLRSVWDFLAVGMLPLAGAGVLVWILTKAIPSIEGAARWSLIGAAILGALLMCISAFVTRSPFFLLRRQVYDPNAAVTVQKS
jgi:amino acid transporter